MRLLVFLAALAAAGAAAAQHHKPYAGQESRDIKALSAEEVRQYLEGAGMGYAKAAELNGWPGPMHVLELADKLSLSAEQRAATERLMAEHKAEAKTIGARLVAAERELEALWKGGEVDAAALSRAVERAAMLEGEYRLAHLETHRRMKAMLTPEQVARYVRLRGYAAGGHGQHKH